MTKKQLELFVKVRNASGHSSNLQFQIDAEFCGFRADDLGDAKRVGDDHHYIWETPHGILREWGGVMSLEAKDKRAA